MATTTMSPDSQVEVGEGPDSPVVPGPPLVRWSAIKGRDRAKAVPSRATEDRRRWWALVAVALVPFLVVLEDHAIAIALPSLGRDLGLGLVGLEWVVSVYAVAAAVLTLGGGALTDRFGARPVFLAGLALFTIAALLAGLSTDGATLIGMRAAQGAGTALMVPAALAILVTSFSGSGRGLAFGVWSGLTAGATAAGPLAGALLTETAGWRSIFLINVPLGVLALIIAGISLPASRSSSPRTRSDFAGVVTSALGLSALIFGFTQATSYGWTSVRTWAMLGTAAIAFMVFVLIERRASAPLLDPSLFRIPNFLAADALALINVAVQCSLLLFLSLFLQFGAGSSPLRAGLALLPLTVAVVVVSPLAGWLVSRAGARLLSSAGLAIMVFGLVVLSRISPGSGPVDMLWGLLLTGVGIGLTATASTTAAMEHVPAERTGIAAATLNASGMMGMSLGIAVMGGIVAARLPSDLTSPGADPAAFAAGIENGILANAALALVAVIPAVTAIRTAATWRFPVFSLRQLSEWISTRRQTSRGLATADRWPERRPGTAGGPALMPGRRSSRRISVEGKCGFLLKAPVPQLQALLMVGLGLGPPLSCYQFEQA